MNWISKSRFAGAQWTAVPPLAVTAALIRPLLAAQLAPRAAKRRSHYDQEDVELSASAGWGVASFVTDPFLGMGCEFCDRININGAQNLWLGVKEI